MFKDFLDKMKGYKYQITFLLIKQNKKNGDIEFGSVYFNSNTKTVINSEYMLWLMKDVVG